MLEAELNGQFLVGDQKTKMLREIWTRKSYPDEAGDGNEDSQGNLGWQPLL
jgi:hypothetical protein